MKTKAVLFTTFMMFALTNATWADVINVPDDHETIQEGINAAEDGDAILVSAGEYVDLRSSLYYL